MAGDFDLISDAERQRALDAVQRRADRTNMTMAERSSFTARVHAAQTHAGLDSVLTDLPREDARAAPLARPATVARPTVTVIKAPAWQRATIILAAAITGVGFLAWAVMGLAGATDDDPTSAPPTTAELPVASIDPTVPTTTAPPTTVPTTVAPTTLAPTTLPFDLPHTTRVVGQDIQPGRYLSTTPYCFWEIRSSLEPGDQHVLAIGTTGGRHVVVDIAAGDVALVSDCDWKPYTPPAEPATTIPDGDWVVGSDVHAGTYQRADPDGFDKFCMWERARGFRHHYDEIVAYGFPTGPDSVKLAAGDRFTTEACGPWTKVG